MPSGHTSRHATPPNNDTRLAAPSTARKRSPGASPNSPSSASSGSIRTPNGNSPNTLSKQTGPTLLPKIRKQDQTLDSINIPDTYHHKQTPGPRHGFPFPNLAPVNHYHPRASTPPEHSLLTPVSAISRNNVCNDNARASTPPHSAPARQQQHHHPHSRSTWSSFVEDYSRTNSHSRSGQPSQPHYLYQQYQCPHDDRSNHPQYDQYHRQDHNQDQHLTAPLPVAIDTGYVQQPPTPSQHSPLAKEYLFQSYPQAEPTITLLQYLTTPNPSATLVRHASQPDRIHDMHFWWDVRNVRGWTNFNLDSIYAVPDLPRLLSCPLRSSAFPHFPRANPTPDSLSALHDMYTNLLAPRIKYAVKASCGEHYLEMHAHKASPYPGAPKSVPDFIASYAPPDPHVPASAKDARVIGLIRTYETWNSGMRSSNDPRAKVSYLRELAHLQHHLRAHNCRYGFILSEIELVCVRMGAAPGMPVFGFLELSEPIQLATHGSGSAGPASRHDSGSSSGSGHAGQPRSSHASRPASAPTQAAEVKLTVPLALWYLHMLAKDQPLPGQPSWRIETGTPAACTRRNVIPRDETGFMRGMKPEGREKRDAKRCRGWIFPEEALAKKEVPKQRRWTKKMEKERVEREEKMERDAVIEEQLREHAGK